MMGAAGEPSGYYPMDSNGLAVQSELPAPCVCPVVQPQAPMVCPPLLYSSCVEVGGFEICFILPGWCEPPKKEPTECTPDDWNECRKACKESGSGQLFGCAYVDFGKLGGVRKVCVCLRGCDKRDEEECRKECHKQKKPFFGCAWVTPIGAPFAPPRRVCICEPKFPGL
ncbi:hypothetical protein HRbin15_02603 [bacterium HR15]|nr:hypothetical protein HRbin15_02603 [bacterium HR15]